VAVPVGVLRPEGGRPISVLEGPAPVVPAVRLVLLLLLLLLPMLAPPMDSLPPVPPISVVRWRIPSCCPTIFVLDDEETELALESDRGRRVGRFERLELTPAMLKSGVVSPSPVRRPLMLLLVLIVDETSD
jgi:hypothetical protein